MLLADAAELVGLRGAEREAVLHFAAPAEAVCLGLFQAWRRSLFQFGGFATRAGQEPAATLWLAEEDRPHDAVLRRRA